MDRRKKLTQKQKKSILLQIQEAINEWKNFDMDSKRTTDEALKAITEIKDKTEYITAILENCGFGKFWEFAQEMLIEETKTKQIESVISEESKKDNSFMDLYVEQLRGI